MKFVLVEDQVMFRDLIRKLLMQECKGEILLETNTLAELRSKFDKVRAADLLLLDIQLPDGDGISIVNELSAALIDTPVLLFSSSADDYIVDRFRKSSAQGIVHKEENEEVLVKAIQNVSAGGAYCSPRFADRIKQFGNNPFGFDKILSKREQELLCYLGSGYSDVEVAAMTGSKAGTIQTHRRNIMNKFGVRSA